MDSHGRNASDLGSLPRGREASQREVSFSPGVLLMSVLYRQGSVQLKRPRDCPSDVIFWAATQFAVGGNRSDHPDTKRTRNLVCCSGM